MRNPAIATALLGAVLLTATAADAQRLPSAEAPNRGSFGIVPFAGYLFSEPLVEGPLNTSLGASGGALYGAQASLPFASWAALVGTVGYASSDLRAGLPLIGGISVGDSRTLLFDAAFELRAGVSASDVRFVPVLHVGGGALNRKLTVAGVAAESTDFVVSAGIGGDFPLGSNVAVRLMAKDHYGSVDFGSLGPVSGRTDSVHAIALSAGLRFAF